MRHRGSASLNVARPINCLRTIVQKIGLQVPYNTKDPVHKYILLPVLCLTCILFSDTARAQLRIVTYNTNTFGTEVGGSNIRTIRAGADIVLQAIGEESVNGIARPADIILLQEQQQPATTTQDFLNRLNAIYQSQGITYARGFEVGNTTSGSGFGTPSEFEIRQGVIYRTDSVELISEDSFGDLSGGLLSQPRETLLHQFRPIGFNSDADLFVFNAHFEAGDDDEDLAGQETEADQIRQFIDSNNLGTSNVIVAGDLNVGDNFTSSSLTVFGGMSALEILADDGPGRVLDPLFPNGEMVNFTIFAGGVPNTQFGVDLEPVLTQSPSGGAGPLVGGGIDDRFDFILQSDELLDGSGVASIPGSLRAFGNNGSTPNTQINNGNTIMFNGLISFSTDEVLDALEAASDHLPVVEDFQLPATLVVEIVGDAAIEFGDPAPQFAQGEDVTLELLVSNGTNVQTPLGADVLEFTVSATGDVSGSFSSTDEALGDGVSVFLDLDTSQLGIQTGFVSVTSNGEGAVLDGSSQFAFSYIVASVALPGDFEPDGDVDPDDVDFYSGNLDQVADGDLVQLDLDGDGFVTLDDHNFHIENLLQISDDRVGTIVGDITLDGTVDVLGDAFTLIGNLGSTSGVGYATGDLNADGAVDVLGDAFLLVGNIGSSVAP